MAANKATYDTAMKRAHQYAWSNQWERALKEFKRALAHVPDDPEARRNIAQCHFRLKQWPQALEAYQALLATDGSDHLALNRIAEIYLALGRQDQAIATYNQLADLFVEGKQTHEAVRALRDLSRALPRDVETHNRLLLFAQELGDKQSQLAEHLAISKLALDENNLGEASAHAAAASSLDPENAEVKRWSYAVRRRIAEAASTNQLEGDARPGQGSLTGVIGMGLTGARESDPPEAAALIAQASEAQAHEQYQEAVELYDRAVRAGARTPSAFYNAGLLNQQMGRAGIAIPYLERAAADPEFATSAHYVQGLCYNALRDYSKAVASFERAITLINPAQLTRNEADEMIELYAAAAEANLADNSPGRAGSLYSNLVNIFKERKWQHPNLPELERKANELYNASIMSKLEGISKGSSLLLDSTLVPETIGTTISGTLTLGTNLIPGAEEAATSLMGTSAMGTNLIAETEADLAAAEAPEQGTTEIGTSLMGELLAPDERTSLISGDFDSEALRELQSAIPTPQSALDVDPLEATRLMAGVPDTEEGTNLLQRGTNLIAEDESAGRAAPSADIPTTLISRPGGNLRTITEYLRTANRSSEVPEPALSGAKGSRLQAPGDSRNPGTLNLETGTHTQTSLSTAALLDLEQKNISMQQLIAETEGALHGQKWEVAIDNCFSIIISDPEYLPVHMLLGDIYLAQSKHDEAITKYGTVMDTYVARAEPGRAADACRRLLELEPKNPTLKTRLGLLLLDAGLVDDAARALLAIAEDYKAAGDVRAALLEAEGIKAKLPSSSDVALAVGTYRLELGETREAIVELGRALQYDPSNDAALVRLYKALAWLNDPTQWDALDSLLQRASKDESDTRLFLEEIHAGIQQKPLPATYYGLALLAGRTGLDNVAADALDDGLNQMSLAPTAELDPTWPLLETLMCQFRGDLALSEKDGPVAIQHYRRALKILEAHASNADIGMQNAELEESAADNPQSAIRNPQSLESPRPQFAFLRVPVPVQLQYGLAEAYMMIEDWNGALTALESLKTLTPGDQSVYNRLADIHFRQGHLTLALGDLNDLLVLHQKAGDHEKTLEALGNMAKLAPNNTAVRRKLSDMYLKLGMTDYGLEELATLADLQLKAGQLKEAMRTYQRSADLHYTLGQHDEAIAIYERIVRLAPRDIDTRQQLVNMYIGAGKLNEAVEAERSLADVFIGEGQVEGAIAALHQLLALAPEDVPAHHSLAQQLVSIGEYGQAARLYGRLVRLEPDNERNPILQEEMQRMAREAAEEVTDMPVIAEVAPVEAKAPKKEKEKATAGARSRR